MRHHPVRALLLLTVAAAAAVPLGCGSTSAGTSPPASTTTRASTTTPASTTPSASTTSPTGSSHRPALYLALGDSIAFGYRPPGEVPVPDYASPSSFVGYPEILGHGLGLTVVNASCPGETITSMISTSAKSNGCENIDGRVGGYRTHNPLHTRYGGAQLTFATGYLTTHRDVALVTIGIGLNDVAICRDSTADKCASAAEQRKMLGGIGRGLQQILTSLRTSTGYTGRIVVVTYYERDYADPDSERSKTTRELDSVLSAVARRNHDLVADGYGAFLRASSRHHGDACAAGLTIRLPGGGCDLHPTLEGQTLLATAVRTSLGR